MGTYTNDDKVRKLYPPIDKTMAVTEGQVEFYITQAEAYINGIIAVRYSLPFVTVPQLIITVASEYSVILILDRWLTSQQPTENVWRNKRKEELEAILKGIADGTILLVLEDGTIVGQRSDIHGVNSNTKNYNPTFTDLNPAFQELDGDKVQDQLDELGEFGIERVI